MSDLVRAAGGAAWCSVPLPTVRGAQDVQVIDAIARAVQGARVSTWSEVAEVFLPVHANRDEVMELRRRLAWLVRTGRIRRCGPSRWGPCLQSECAGN